MLEGLAILRDLRLSKVFKLQAVIISLPSFDVLYNNSGLLTSILAIYLFIEFL